MPMPCAMPHRNEASENSMVAHTNRRTSPKRRVRKPVSGSAMALLTANEVITQVLWFTLTPRLPAMVGNDTLAMVVSSTCMKVASDRPTVVNARLGGRKLVLMAARKWLRLASLTGPAASVAAKSSCVRGERRRGAQSPAALSLSLPLRALPAMFAWMICAITVSAWPSWRA